MTNHTQATVEEGARALAEELYSGATYDDCNESVKTAWLAAARRILALPSVGWRTIDSAPKDGTKIIYHNGRTVDPIIGQCRWSDWSLEWSEDESPDACWWDYERDDEASPAFWMPDIPLPAPPATAGKEG